MRSSEHFPCFACASIANRPIKEAGGYRVVECVDCGLLYVNPRPSEAALFEFYSSYHDPDPADRERATLVQLTRQLQRLTRGRRVFEVGCGAGDFLFRLHAEGFRASGCDPQSVALAPPSPVRIHRSALSGCSVDERSFDIVIARNLVEHLRDPVTDLANMGRLLDDDGLLYVKVPNVAYARGLRYRLVSGFGSREDDFIPPLHLNYFSRDTLTRTLARAGFEIVAWHGELPSAASGRIAQLARRTFHGASELVRRATLSWVNPHVTLACFARKRPIAAAIIGHLGAGVGAGQTLSALLPGAVPQWATAR